MKNIYQVVSVPDEIRNEGRLNTSLEDYLHANLLDVLLPCMSHQGKKNNFIYFSQSRGTERHSLHLIVPNCATWEETFLTLFIYNCFLSFLCWSNVDKVKWSQRETARRSQLPNGGRTERVIAMPDYRKQEPCLLREKFWRQSLRNERTTLVCFMWRTAQWNVGWNGMRWNYINETST